MDNDRFSPRFVEDVKALAGGISFDDELGLRLAWEVSVKAYNMALLDDSQIEAPIAEAQALLERYPHYALRVQTGWAGGHRGQHYRGDNRIYWPVDLEAKLEPVLAAVQRLEPTEQAAFYQSWNKPVMRLRPLTCLDMVKMSSRSRKSRWQPTFFPCAVD